MGAATTGAATAGDAAAGDATAGAATAGAATAGAATAGATGAAGVPLITFVTVVSILPTLVASFEKPLSKLSIFSDRVVILVPR